MLTPAPFFEDVAFGPPGGAAHWVTCRDGVRIRVGHLRPEGAARGTVLLFPGRTEFIEKYGDAAGEFAARGYATLAVDWRGQGLAARLTEDRRIGHVLRFTDYQQDVAAVLQAAEALGLPRPWHLLGHSMGGGIGLRAAMDGMAVQSCVFTGPMWGIYMSPLMRPMGWTLAYAGPAVGMGLRLPPSTRYESYVTALPFEGNTLTTDRTMYERMRLQLERHPELGLGGPSLVWLREALAECRALAQRPSPALPCLTFLGAREKIVDCDAVRARMRAWPLGELDIVHGAEHEVMMETPAIRRHVFDRMVALFDATAVATPAARSA